jgi:hypothetical protein
MLMLVPPALLGRWNKCQSSFQARDRRSLLSESMYEVDDRSQGDSFILSEGSMAIRYMKVVILCCSVSLVHNSGTNRGSFHFRRHVASG